MGRVRLGGDRNPDYQRIVDRVQSGEANEPVFLSDLLYKVERRIGKRFHRAELESVYAQMQAADPSLPDIGEVLKPETVQGEFNRRVFQIDPEMATAIERKAVEIYGECELLTVEEASKRDFIFKVHDLEVWLNIENSAMRRILKDELTAPRSELEVVGIKRQGGGPKAYRYNYAYLNRLRSLGVRRLRRTPEEVGRENKVPDGYITEARLLAQLSEKDGIELGSKEFKKIVDNYTYVFEDQVFVAHDRDPKREKINRTIDYYSKITASRIVLLLKLIGYNEAEKRVPFLECKIRVSEEIIGNKFSGEKARKLRGFLGGVQAVETSARLLMEAMAKPGTRPVVEILQLQIKRERLIEEMEAFFDELDNPD